MVKPKVSIGDKPTPEEPEEPEEASEQNPPREPEPQKKRSRARWLKVMVGIALLIGAGGVQYSNAMWLNQGYTLSVFGAYLPLIMIFIALFCFVWAMGKRRKLDTPTAKEEAENQAEGIVLNVIRPCNFTDCPSNFTFEGAGKCGSNGVRPEYCKLSEEEFKELFSEDAYLGAKQGTSRRVGVIHKL
jgi:hypothetical protein